MKLSCITHNSWSLNNLSNSSLQHSGMVSHGKTLHSGFLMDLLRKKKFPFPLVRRQHQSLKLLCQKSITPALQLFSFTYHIVVQYYHYQFAESWFFHGSALVELAVPANISTPGKQEKLPTAHNHLFHRLIRPPLPFCQPTLSLL